MIYNQEWYGTQASIIEQGDNFLVVDYGCGGRGIITSYFLFAGTGVILSIMIKVKFRLQRRSVNI